MLRVAVCGAILTCVCLCRMADFPEKYSKEWHEMKAEDPSQIQDNAAEAAMKAAAGKVVKKASDADVGNEEESDVIKKLRADLAAAKLDAVNAKAEALAAKSAKKKRAPKGLYKAQCDDTMKKINPSLKYILANHKEQHRELYMLGLFVKEYTDAAPESDDHDAYKRWLTDNKEYIGLKKQVRKSTNASFNTSSSFIETNEESTDDDEDEEAGACAGSD